MSYPKDPWEPYPDSKGGVNPPNNSLLRPPAPKGSGRQQPVVIQIGRQAKKERPVKKILRSHGLVKETAPVTVFTVILSKLGPDGIIEIKEVCPRSTLIKAMALAEEWVSGGENPQQINEYYFTAQLGEDYLEARIHKGTLR